MVPSATAGAAAVGRPCDGEPLSGLITDIISVRHFSLGTLKCFPTVICSDLVSQAEFSCLFH